jgi:pyruvate dehydrogenase E2 component (dihydrolipoamide acetyltransferase)
MALTEVKVPDIGDSGEVSVIELLVKPGDTVKAEQSLVTLESDKASMEIPSTAAGVVKDLKVKLGDKVKEGSLLVVLESDSTASSSRQNGSAPPSSPVPPVPAAPLAAQPSANNGNQKTEVRVPDIGDFKDVAVIELLVKLGDRVKPEQSLITVESDKASMEIPSSAGGVVKELKVKLGDKVNSGDLIAVLEKAAGSGDAVAPAIATPAPVASAVPAASAAPAESAAPGADRVAPALALPPHEPGASTGHLPHASPRCASSPVNWGYRWTRSGAPAPKDVSPTKMCKVLPEP